MALREELQRSGAWLFRWRSYVPPLLLVPLSLAALENHRHERAGLETLPTAIGLAVALVGIVIRAAVIGYAPTGTSGKNRSLQVADTLTTTGLYSVVRHPLYLGNFFLWLGPALATGSWWAPVLVGLLFWLYHERIMFVEEEFLRDRFREPYLRWASETPAFVPSPRRWRSSPLSFSLRTVLRQEYYGFFSTVAMFALLEVATTALETGEYRLARPWVIAVAAAAVVSGTLRILQRYTEVLDVEGR